MPRRGKNPTLRDVALLAGVSPMTVSRVLHQAPGVASTTRHRVIAAITICGYRPNELARRLRRGHGTDLIGLLVPDLSRGSHSQLAVGVDMMAAQHGLRVIVSSTGQSEDKEGELVGELLARGVEGLIAVPSGADQRHLGAATNADVPVVLAQHPPVGFTADCVLVDDFGGARDATEWLLSHGHRRVGFLGSMSAGQGDIEALRGYMTVLSSSGLPTGDLVRWCQDTPGRAEHAAVELLALPNPPAAIVCSSPSATAGALRAVRSQGTGATVVGFADFPLAADLPLTRITYDAKELGRTACRLLVARLHNRRDHCVSSEAPGTTRPPRCLIVPTHLLRHRH
ncbi:LacI family DNA-binding transcriptional regulator [Streptomyces spectabilis]|uniref:LacI family DNA-binding transcriptional regulator n=1 Tax=Streptomyces spectabilis TaxID=68270 RepID=UPI00340432DB